MLTFSYSNAKDENAKNIVDFREYRFTLNKQMIKYRIYHISHAKDETGFQRSTNFWMRGEEVKTAMLEIADRLSQLVNPLDIQLDRLVYEKLSHIGNIQVVIGNEELSDTFELVSKSSYFLTSSIERHPAKIKNLMAYGASEDLIQAPENEDSQYQNSSWLKCSIL